MRSLKTLFVQGAAILVATLTFTLTGGAAPAGLTYAIKGAKIATDTNVTTTIMPKTASLFRISRRQASPHKLVCLRTITSSEAARSARDWGGILIAIVFSARPD